MEINQYPRPHSTSHALRIFLVEDVPAVRELIVSSLSELGGITWAGFSDSENDAIQKLQQDDCDILIIDIELKQGNGMSLLRKLMQTKSQQHCLKIIFSNNVCDAYRRAGNQYGVKYFFDKSFELPELHALLQRIRTESITSQNS